MLYSIPKTKMLRSAEDSLSPAARPRSIFAEIAIFLLVMMVISVPQSMLSSVVTSVFMFLDEEYMALMNEVMNGAALDTQTIMDFAMDFMTRIPPEAYVLILASSGIMIPGAIIYCRCFEKRPIFSMGFIKRGALSEYIIGSAVGALMITLPAVVCSLTGAATLSFDSGADPLIIVLFFLAFVLQGMGEEALFRGYLLTSLCRRANVWVAIVISSLMFSLMHVGNANFSIIAFINIALFGVFAAVYMLKRGSIWGVGAIHTVWNFMQGNIFGFSVSGNPQMPTVFNCELGGFGGILSGGEFGIEGGLGATVVLLVAILAALIIPAKRSELWEAELKTE